MRFQHFTKAEDAIPASDVAPPIGQYITAPLWNKHHCHTVGEHGRYGIDELLCARRDFLLQTSKSGLKKYGGNACTANLSVRISVFIF